MDKKINYRFFHWGPFLFRNNLTQDELDKIQKLCSKEGKDYRKNLAGLIKNEHEVDREKLFPIIEPYVQSYSQAYSDYSNKALGKNIELKESWVNYMIAGESNPPHFHSGDLSFIIFLKVPKQLKEECNKTVSSGHKPGAINFIINLDAHDEFISQHGFTPEVGDFYIFPSILYHYVNSFKSEGERVSLSGNLKIKK